MAFVRGMRGTRLFVLALAASFVAGCSAFPTAGPNSYDVRNSEEGKNEDSLPYALVKINANVLNVLAEASPRFANTFPDRRAGPEIRFGVGDVVSVTIFEAAAGGLFIP